VEMESLSLEDFYFSMKSQNLSKKILAQTIGNIALTSTEVDR